MADQKQFDIHFDEGGAVSLTGIMHLASQEAYETELARIQDELLSKRHIALDLSGVKFMNSSGIRWLCVLVLEAKRLGATMSVRGDMGVVWQAKSLPGVGSLYDQLVLNI